MENFINLILKTLTHSMEENPYEIKKNFSTG